MAKAGTCSICGTHVWLTEYGACQFGHDASCVFDIYEADPGVGSGGETVLRTVRGGAITVAPDRMEMILGVAPLVAAKMRASAGTNWGWPAQKLAGVDPDAAIIHSLQCYHGEHNKGWLVGTLDRMYWLGKNLVHGESVQPLFYDWIVEVNVGNAALNMAFAFVPNGGTIALGKRPATLLIGADQFQMRPAEADEFVALIREMRHAGAMAAALEREEEERQRAEAAAAYQPQATAGASPAEHLKGLAELLAMGAVTEEEYQAKKAEILSREWH